MINYKKLAHKIFHPQLITDIEDTENLINVCKDLVRSAGYPLLEDDGESEGWIEFIYEAQDIWEISKNGFIYKRMKNTSKKDGYEMVLYTRLNHPAFQY